MKPEIYQQILAQSQQLATAEEVEAALDRMAQDIRRDLALLNPLVLCIMTGAVVPAGLLLPRLDFPLQLDYLHATRYRGTTRGGTLRWEHRPTEAVRGRQVLLLDDILDEGITMWEAVEACRADGAAQVYSAVLVEKERERKAPIRADYVGLRVPDRYVFGYGLDYEGYFRNAAGIYAIPEARES